MGDTSEEYKKLTALLHIKPETSSIIFNDFISIIKQTLSNSVLPNETLLDTNTKILESIYNVADQIELNTDETLELEKKIVLSIAIRLKSEEYMISNINDSTFVDGISKNQTSVLMEKYQEKFPDNREALNILRRVNLMTPENIHLNSFMYEPILDMSNEHLKVLYKDVKSLFIVD